MDISRQQSTNFYTSRCFLSSDSEKKNKRKTNWPIKLKIELIFNVKMKI